jgi:hypothetical protein
MQIDQTNSLKKQLDSLKQRNAIQRKLLRDELGDGIWGLEEKNSFSHEEIVFLFARVFPALGIDRIKKVQTNYPDCICEKDGQKFAIEFEPKLSQFNDHIGKHDLSECDCIVCWEDNLKKYDPIREEINKHDIEVVELKEFYNENRIRNRNKPAGWSINDIMRLSENQLKVLSAFIMKDTSILSKQEISNIIQIEGRALGGVLGGFPRRGIWIVRKHPRGYQFNDDLREKVEKVLEEFGQDIGITY